MLAGKTVFGTMLELLDFLRKTLLLSLPPQLPLLPPLAPLPLQLPLWVFMCPRGPSAAGSHALWITVPGPKPGSRKQPQQP